MVPLPGTPILIPVVPRSENTPNLESFSFDSTKTLAKLILCKTWPVDTMELVAKCVFNKLTKIISNYDISGLVENENVAGTSQNYLFEDKPEIDELKEITNQLKKDFNI